MRFPSVRMLPITVHRDPARRVSISCWMKTLARRVRIRLCRLLPRPKGLVEWVALNVAGQRKEKRQEALGPGIDIMRNDKLEDKNVPPFCITEPHSFDDSLQTFFVRALFRFCSCFFSLCK